MAFILMAACSVSWATDYTNTIAASRTQITNLMAQHNIPGCTIVLVESQRVVWAEGFGYADKEAQTPVTTNTVMMIGSVSKLLTAMLALQGIDEGAFDLDASITNYLPGVSMLPRFAGQTQGWTLRALLGHHSGLPGDIYNGAFVASTNYWSGYTRWVINYFQEDYPLAPPSLLASYCNSGFNLVGEAVARHDGVDFTKAAENRIFTPLGMPYSSFLLDKSTVTENLATGYNADGSPAPDLLANMPATGGAYARPLDMAQIIKMMLAGGLWGGTPFVSTNALAEMGTFTPGLLDMDNFFKPGLGLDTVDDPALNYAGRAWLKSGSTSKFEALFALLPDQQLGAFVNINCANSMTFPILRAVLTNAVFEKTGLEKPPVPPMPHVAEDFWTFEQLQAVEGYYATKTGADRFIAETNGTLSRIVNAQTGTAVVTNVRPHVNGRFYVPGSNEVQLLFTNMAGYDVLLRFGSDGGVRDEVMYGGYAETLHGTRFVPPAISEAWSNRCDTFWIADNVLDNDSFFAEGNACGHMLSTGNGLLSLLSSGGNATLMPESDTLAFVGGLSTRGDSCVRVETNDVGQERLWFGGYRGVRVEDIPSITNQQEIALSLAMHTNALLVYADGQAGRSVSLRLSTNAADAVISVISLDTDEMLARGAGAVEWECDAGAALIHVASPGAVEARIKAVDVTDVRAAMRQTLADYPHLPGFGVAAQEPGFPPLILTEGYARVDPPSTNGSVALTGHEHFHIASISKMYTAAAIFLLQQRGLLDISHTVAGVIPELNVPRGGDMTIEQVLEHRAGLPDANNTAWIDFKMMDDPLMEFTVAEIVAVASNMYPNLMFEPGTDYSYSDTGYNILAAIVEKVSGTNYQAFVREEVLAPLGLTNTFVPYNDEVNVPEPAMSTYMLIDGEWQDRTVWCPSAEFGCGSIISTLENLLDMTHGFFMQTNLLNAQTHALMMDRVSPGPLSTYGRGCGWQDGLGWGHDGTMWGALSSAHVDTNTGVRVAGCMNMQYEDERYYANMFAIYGAQALLKNAMGYDTGTLGRSTPRLFEYLGATRQAATYRFQPVAFNFPTNWTISGLPEGLEYDAALGEITGVTFQAGNFPVQLTAQNAYGTTNVDLTLSVGLGYTNTIATMSVALEDAQAAGEFVGMGLVLVDESGIAWSTGIGYADRELGIPATADTVFRIGSVSKLFDTVAALRLCDRGQLNLEAPITNYLAGFEIEPRLDTNLPPIDYEANPITVRSLLNHLSGIPSTYMRHAMTTTATWNDIFPNYLGEMIVGILNDFAGLPVGFHASYNNNGFQVIEYLIEQITGDSYDNYTQTNLFMALHMTRSGVNMDAASITNSLAASYFDDLSAAPKEYVNCLGSGGALTTANDMGAFLTMLMSGGAGLYAPVIEPGSVKAMMAVQTTNAALDVGTQFFAPGLGWDTALLPEFEYAGGGCSKNGETTTFAAYTALCTNQNLGVFVVVNSPNVAATTEAAQGTLLLAINEKSGLMPTNIAVLPESPFVAAAQTNVDALAGYYVNDSGYATLRAGTNCLLYGGSALYLREDGWWSKTNEPPFLMGFTNVAGCTFSVLRMVYKGYLETMVTGQKYAPPVLPDAWSNRVDTTWLIASLPDVSYMRTHPGTRSVRLWQTNGLLMLSMPSSYLDNYSSGYFSHTDMVIEPYDDELAFVQGAGGKMPCSVRSDDNVLLANSYYWMNTASIPQLEKSSPTNFAPYPLMTDWFAFEAEEGVEYFLNLGSEVTGMFLLLDEQGRYLGDGSEGSVLRWTCPASGTYYAGVNFPFDAPGEVEVKFYDYTNTIAFVTAWITNAMAEEGTIGCSIALVDGQEIVWSRGFGYADREAEIPVTTNTVFHIGSVSKAFTSAAALQYVDRGTLDLNAPFTNYTPAVSWKPRYGGARPITTTDLLTHNAGLPGDLIRAGFLTEPLGRGYAETTNELAHTYPVLEPGIMNNYCNVAFVLAEGIIEESARLAGEGDRAFSDIVNENMFAALGMEATSYLFDKPAISNLLAIPYRGGERMPPEFVELYGTGSLYSRPTDMARFISAIFAGGASILSNDTCALMLANHSTNTLYGDLFWLQSGLGWDTVTDPRMAYAGKACWKNGATLAYSAQMHLLPGKELGVAIVASSSSVIPTGTDIHTLQHALLDRDGLPWPTNPVVFPTNTAEISQAELDALAGVYAGSSGYDLVEAHPGSLTYHIDVLSRHRTLSNLVIRSNGWFMSDDAPEFAVSFTNAHGRDLVLYKQASGAFEFHDILSERFSPPNISAVWSNRLNKIWVARNNPVNDYLRLIGAAPDLQLLQSNGVFYVRTGGQVANRALVPENDTLAWVPGIINRGDSSVQIEEIDGIEHLRYGGVLYGPTPETIPSADTLAGTIERAGFARWYEIQPEHPAESVGAISNVWYELNLSGAPNNFLLRLYEADGVTPVANRRGNGTLEVASGEQPRLLTIQPDTDGVQTGAFEIAFSVPVIIREIQQGATDTSITWQGPTGTTYAIEAAPFLRTNDTFSPVKEHIALTNLLHREILPASPDPVRFYRITKQDGPTNRFGKILMLSDFHFSPFTEQRIAEYLFEALPEAWDDLFAEATNGLFTTDATGHKTTSPLLLQSALTNAWSACPQPDAVIVPGDFPYYDLIGTYTNLVVGSTREQGQEVLRKTFAYIHMKIRQTFPDAPIHFALGNNDTFLDDYDMEESGDPFYHDTADIFYAGAFTNNLTYEQFTATYTNRGNYTAPFGAGDLISMQTLYLSANYTRSTSPGWAQLEHLQIELTKSSDAGRPAWILLHIPPGIDSFATWQEWKTGNTNAAITDWRPEFVTTFCQIIASNAATVAGLFAGHYHNRGWQLISDPATSNALATLQIANGILYNHGNNPGFTVLTYDRTTLHFIAEATYSLDVATHTGSLDPTVPWNIRYSQNETFGTTDLTTTSLETAWQSMNTFDSAPAQFYNQAYSGGRPPYAMTSTNWPVYYNAIRYTTPGQFLENR